MSRSRKPAEPEPPREPDLAPPNVPEDPEPEAAEAVPLITDKQLRMMQALFTERGFTDRDDRLAYVTDVVGIEVATSKDLTVDQASAVIDALQSLES